MSDNSLSLNIVLKRKDFSLQLKEDIPGTGITAIFGESGAGKTTLLRLIAGFEKPHHGHIKFGQDVWYDTAKRIHLRAFKRPVGFMFQGAQLFADKTVQQNLSYAEKRNTADANSLFKDDIIMSCDIGSLLGRYPTSLSGGEYQRVALARTLMTQPDLLLLDEPLAALDRQRKIELISMLEDLLQHFRIPTLYVSHDIDEVSRIADRVLMLDSGRATSFGSTVSTLAAYGFEAGRNPYEVGALITGKVRGQDVEFGLMEIGIGSNSIWLPALRDVDPGETVAIRISPKDVSISVDPPSGLSMQNSLSCVVKSIDDDRASAFCTLTLLVESEKFEARITRKALKTLNLQIGQPVFALIKTASFQR
ncbi:MAG: molybdenum ABC transporter ATP-binding protein [Pseudomonadota bacterium]